MDTAQPASLDKGLDQPLGHGVQGDLLGGGDDDAAHSGGHFAALERCRGLAGSSRRPLVQEPITTWSMWVPAA